MTRKRKDYRELKVSSFSGYGYKSAPMLRIQGLWLEELGFNIGDPILVKCEDGKLIITVDHAREDAETKEQPLSLTTKATASSSVYLRFALPSTTLNPGYSVPDKACCKAYSLMSAAQAVRSSIFGRIAAISVSLKEAGISKSYLASSRLYSARLRQVALALQKVQWSPALNSPSPLKASSAVGFKKSSAHFRRSSFLIVKVLTFSRRGWKMVIFTEVMS